MSGTDGIIRIFAGTASKGFAQKMCDYLGTQMGDCRTIIFSEGNNFVRINESIRDKDVYFVQTLGPVSYTHLDVYKRQTFCSKAKRSRSSLPSVICLK